jgi:hypothetical protein
MRSLLLLTALAVQSVFGTENRQIKFSGNQAFTTQQLRQALNASEDYAFVSHPLATKEEFQKNLAHLLQVAYADRGYVDTQVIVTPLTPGKWNVRIKEGQQFTCGKVIVPSKSNPIAQELVVFLSKSIEGYDPTTDNPNDAAPLDQFYQPTDWVAGQPARLTQTRLEALGWNARLFCFLKGYTKAKAILLPKPRKNGTIDMEILMNLGKKQFGPDEKPAVLKLSHVRVHGSAANKPEDYLKFLGLRSGMPITQTMCQDFQKKLWNSGRFLAVDVFWRKIEEKESVGIDIHVTECPNVPLLTEALPEHTKQALAIYRSLMATKFNEGQQEWAMRLIVDAFKADDLPKWKALLGGNRGQLYAVFDANKGMGITTSSASGNEPEALLWGAVSQTGKKTGIFLSGEKVQWVAPDRGKSAGAIINLSLTPVEEGTGPSSGQVGKFNIGGGFSTNQSVPLKFNINFPPATILAILHSGKFRNKMDMSDIKSKTTTSDKGIIFNHFTLTLTDQSDPKPIAIPIQAKTRRDARDNLLSLQIETEVRGVKFNFKLSPSQNALNELTNRLTQETKTHFNQYKSDHGFSTLFGFLGTHAAPLIYKNVTRFEDKDATLSLLGRAKLEAQVQLFKTFGPQLQKALEPFDKLTPNSPGPFEIRRGIFMDQLVTSKITVDGNTKQIPLGEGRWSISSPHGDREFDFQMRERTIDESSLSLPSLLSTAIIFSGPILADNAWPKIINREYNLIQIHSAQYTEAALLQMVETGKAGPIACLVAANLLNSMDLPGGMRCAKAGLERLNEKGMRLDKQPFTDPNSPMIHATDRFLETANPILVKKIVDEIYVELLGQNQKAELLKRLAANEKIKPVEILGPVIANTWKQLIPTIANELQMAQFGSLRHIRASASRGEAEYQFILGIMYFQGRGLSVDLVEAFAWASHSARKNYPNAANLRNAIMKQMTPEEILRGMKRSSEIK